MATPPSHDTKTWPESVAIEFRAQRGIALPLIAMNLTWFAKLAVTTAFLGRLGDLQLAAGTLGFSFANVTGFAVLTGLCNAMDPICGQAHGASNAKLLRKTLLMATILLLAASIPIAFLWLHVDAVLRRFGQQPDITANARTYVVCLLPDLAVTSFLSPLKSYLSAQGITLPTLFSSALALALHVPLTMWMARTKGIQGVASAVWISDLAVAVMLAAYVLASERLRKAAAGGWLEQTTGDWLRLLRLAVPSCLNTCLEWWCYEILVLLTGRLPDARRMVGVMAVTLNFDYLLFAGMLSLSVVNFPLNVCGGIVRGTARPAVGMYAVLGGFYVVALPVAVALAFKARLGIDGLLLGFLLGAALSLAVLLTVIARMDWAAEADKARRRVHATATTTAATGDAC
uniref:Protein DETOXIFICATION n=1 Tax=Oryza brachyantha TaxID=4533 RepID=J3LUZ9_ORYBR